MSFETAIIIAGVLLVATVAGVISVVAARRLAAQNEELKRQASMRGWAYEATRERSIRVRRWRATTDGVAWMAESLERSGNDKRRAIHLSRWHTTSSRGPAAPIVCLGVPKGKETPRFQVAQGEGMLAALAQKAAGFMFDKSLDTHFGEDVGREVDARLLKPVPGAAVTGFIVMAEDPDAASRVLFQGLGTLLTSATSDTQSALADNDTRPWVLLWKKGVSLGRTERFRTTEDVERFARAGATLARFIASQP